MDFSKPPFGKESKQHVEQDFPQPRRAARGKLSDSESLETTVGNASKMMRSQIKQTVFSHIVGKETAPSQSLNRDQLQNCTDSFRKPAILTGQKGLKQDFSSRWAITVRSLKSTVASPVREQWLGPLKKLGKSSREALRDSLIEHLAKQLPRSYLESVSLPVLKQMGSQ